MKRALAIVLLAAGWAGAGPVEDAVALDEAGKPGEAADLLEKAAADGDKNPEILVTLVELRAKLKQWTPLADAVVRLGKSGVAFETDERFRRRIQEATGSCVWYGNTSERIAVFGKLAAELPQSPWRTGWLCVVLTNQAREGRMAEVDAIEKELFSKPLDGGAKYRIGRAYVEVPFRPEKAVELLEAAVADREAQPLAEDALARETFVTDTGVCRAYLAFAYSLSGRTGKGNRFWEKEPETSGFENATEAAGLKEANGGRIAVGDYDGDGWDDLSLNGAVWHNDHGTFTKLAADAGATSTGNGSLWGDADNDGDIDLWVFSQDKAVRLYLNDAGKFKEAAGTGMDGALEAGPEGAALGDVNGDGILDAYLAVYESGDLGGGRADKLFLSKGKMKWEESLEAAGMGAEKTAPQAGRGVNMGDFDNDGDLDIFVSNYRLCPNYLWRNEGGGKFSNVSRELGVEGVPSVAGKDEPTYYGHTIGSCWADLDNDMDLDLVSANLAHPRFIAFSNKTQVLMNQGKSHGWKFADIFPWSGVPYEETHSDVSACDYDNDGDQDLYFTSVYPERPSWLNRNDGTGHFEAVTWRAGAVLFNGWGHAWLDADNDGDMDMIVCAGGHPRLLRNALPAGSSWLQVRLRSSRGNATAVGAKIRVYLGDSRQLHEVAAGRGTTSQDSTRAHFGFGKRTGKAVVAVTWPDGRTERLENVELNRVLEVTEPK